MTPYALSNPQDMCAHEDIETGLATDELRTAPMPPAWFEALICTIGWTVALIGPGLVFIVCSSFLETDRNLFEDHRLAATLCGQFLALALTVFVLKSRVGPDWLSALHVRCPALVHCLLAVLCLSPLVIPGILVLLIQGSDGPHTPLAASAFLFVLLVRAVGPAVTEELFFRGFLGRLLLGRYGMVLGVLLTSVLFALVHLPNVPQAVFAFVFGCLAHMVYLATRSLWVPVLLHFLANAIYPVLGQFAGPIPTPDPAFEPTEAQMCFALGALVISLAAAILAGWGLYCLEAAEHHGKTAVARSLTQALADTSMGERFPKNVSVGLRERTSR